MKYYNINNPKETVSLREAVLKSSPNSAGLYMPCHIPILPETFFKSLHTKSLQQIAVESSIAMFGDEIPTKDLEKIVTNALNFDIPLRQLDENLFVLELFHGPTMAFKDVGARFMAGLFEYFSSNEVVILVATSGDTGGAVANAFYNHKGVRVVVLYPSGCVSEFQERQIATMGGNITALEVDGDFDDCQRMVKQAFSDSDINSHLTITSANSINFARLFPQSFYYHYAAGQIRSGNNGACSDKQLVISVPCGNFGNLTAGLIAKRMGLPVKTFIAANNANHSVTDYLNGAIFEPRSTQHTITNAMDVGNPSNFPRIMDLYNDSHSKVVSDVKGDWFDDAHTLVAMNELQEHYGYQADPHGALAYMALRKYLKGVKNTQNIAGVFLETAHPAKFQEPVKLATGKEAPLLSAIKVSNHFNDLKHHLLTL